MSVTLASITQGTGALNSLIVDIKGRIGVFLQNSQKIEDAKIRAKALSGISGVSGTANALVSKAQALETIQTNIETQAQNLLGRLSTLKSNIETRPEYSFLRNVSFTSMVGWGTRQYEIIGQILSQITSLGQEGAGVTARILAQNKDVTNLLNEVRGTESAAAGTGYLPRVSQLIQGTVGSLATSLAVPLKGPLMVGAVAVAAFYFWPRIVQGFASRRS